MGKTGRGDTTVDAGNPVNARCSIPHDITSTMLSMTAVDMIDTGEWVLLVLILAG